MDVSLVYKIMENKLGNLQKHVKSSNSSNQGSQDLWKMVLFLR